MANATDLRRTLERIDGRGYKAYKDIQGSYDFEAFELIVDHVQGDPFAAPSKLRVRVPQSVAAFPRSTFQSRSRQTALRDYLTRAFARAAGRASANRGTGKSGMIAIDTPSQEILARTSVIVDDEIVEARFVAGLPAKGRKVMGKQAAAMLCEDLPAIAQDALLYGALDARDLQRHVETAEDADALRDQLRERGLVAFVADGAILPRRSGVDDRPLSDSAVPFQSPASLSVELDRPNGGPIAGMGVPPGVSVVVGGGYHGKSTLLSAISLGVYNHVPRDGREFVVSDPAAVFIRAEDGRGVTGVDISPFINNLPQDRSTRDFSSEDASGSTSQAANIVEALEVGASTLLIDEDTSATNFMIRDHRMQELIAKDKEPITPFIDKIRQLYDDRGVSSILVMGGSGDYFDVADTVIAMEHFRPHDVTDDARAIAAKYRTDRRAEGGEAFGEIAPRIPDPHSIDPSKGKKGKMKLKTRETDEIVFGSDAIDLSAVHQLADESQLRGIAQALVHAKERHMNRDRTLAEVLDALMAEVDENGLDVLSPFVTGDLAEFRRFELAAALNRLRSLRVRQRTRDAVYS
ncbi:MAG: ABC-ATPase domain-containing protein [Candidatus Bipolaricaulia bacterium]